MSHARSQHPNAPLTPEGRHRMVDCVLSHGWTIEATAERFQVDAKTVRKWRDRFRTEGQAGLADRSSRPRRSPNRTPRRLRRRVIHLRRKHRWGADHIGHEVGLAASTVQNILNHVGLGRLDRGDRATNTPAPQRYQRDLPGELIHVDVKKLAAIPDGGGWKPSTDLSFTLGFTWGRTVGAGEAPADYSATDLRVGGRATWVVGRTFFPYAALRLFGGPVTWDRESGSRTGGNEKGCNVVLIQDAITCQVEARIRGWDPSH